MSMLLPLPFGGSQSLLYQGSVLTRERWKIGASAFVSIPSLSGLRSNTISVTNMTPIGSQSLLYQGSVLTCVGRKND